MARLATLVPPPRFKWKFLGGFWALLLVKVITSPRVANVALVSKELEDTDTQSTDEASLDHISESDDLMFEFERNLRELLLGLHSGKDVASFSNNGKLNEVRD